MSTPTVAGTERRIARFWAVPLVLLAVIYLWEVTHQWFSTSDTHAVLLGTAAAQDCLNSGRLSNCAAAGYDVSHYPPLQYLPVYLMKVSGFSLQEAYKGLCWLNAAAYAGLLGLMWHAGRRSGSRALGPLLVACGLAAPLLWYSHAGFREVLVAFIRTLLVVSVLLDWPIVLTMFAACLSVLSNDPALLFIFGIGVLALLARNLRDGAFPRRQGAAFAAGIVAGGILFAAFNVFRYGNVLNTWFLDAHVDVPGINVRLSSLAALVAAPNVGLVWYWPLALLVFGLVGVSAWRMRRSGRETAALGGGVLALLAAWLLFLIVFYSPFGWEAWGPRYLLGWVPALLVLGGFIFAGPITARVTALFSSTRRFVSAAVIVVVLALPQFGVFLDWHAGFRLFNPDAACPIHLPDPREYSRMFGDMGPYYACKLHQAWGHKPALLDGYAVLGHPWTALQAAVYALAVVALLFQARPIYPRSG